MASPLTHVLRGVRCSPIHCGRWCRAFAVRFFFDRWPLSRRPAGPLQFTVPVERQREETHPTAPPLAGASPRPLVRPASTPVPFPSSPAFSQSRDSLLG